MFLTNEQIKACATGWLFAEEDGDGITFYRFSQEHRKQFAAHEPPLGARMLGSASVTLDFWTDAASVAVCIDGHRAETTARGISMDFCIDGNLSTSAQITAPPLPNPERVYESAILLKKELPEGEHRVTVYLPWNLCTRIRSVELEGETVFRPHCHKYRWLAMGDSITQGVIGEHTSLTYVNRLARMLDARVLNLGIGGDVMREKGVLPGQYGEFDFVTVAYGTNDYAHRKKESFDRHMPGWFRVLAEHYPTTPIFVLLPLWRGMEDRAPENPLGTLQAVRDRIAAEAAKYPNMTVIDCQHFLPHGQEYFGDTTLLHPNDLGFGVYAEKLYEILKDRV